MITRLSLLLPNPVMVNLLFSYKVFIALIRYTLVARVQQVITKPVEKAMAAQEYKTLSVLIFIVSLLVEHCDFDKLRSDNPGTISFYILLTSD
jgi:cohesin loading factor subunit SCC2